MPTVSVIIPNYNHARFLRQRIDTVLGQTYQDIEVIIMDDCSTDDSRDVIQDYQHDARVSVVLNEDNSGCVFKQWNKGLGLARGKYVWIAESDDYSAATFLQTMVGCLDANPEIGVAFCDSYHVSGDVIKLARENWYREFADKYENDFVINGRQYVAEQMVFCCCIPNASSAVFRRAKAQEAGPADESLRLSGDWLFWIRLLAQSDLAYVATSLNYFRHHDQTVRHRTVRNGVYLEEAYRVSLEILENFPVSRDDVIKVREQLTDAYVVTMFTRGTEIPRARRRNIRHLANRMNPYSSLRLWYWLTGLHWLWLGCRRRALAVVNWK
jgi:glycosyltransferase involved in cell wall biosynthesis